jgi:5-formyltetrahydrofolate cyclo-ligase
MLSKTAMRSRMRQVLQNIPRKIIDEQSKLVTIACLNWLKRYEKEQRRFLATSRPVVGIFLSKSLGEIQTANLCKELLTGGYEVYVPFISNGEMDMVQLLPTDDVELFSKDEFGRPIVPDIEKRKKISYVGVDVVFTSGIAFELETLKRLGSENDYFIEFLRNVDDYRFGVAAFSPVIKIGLALNEMVLPAVPTDKRDIVLDGIITPDRELFQRDRFNRYML